MHFFLFIIVAVTVLLVILTVQNPSTRIAVDFIKWTYEGPVALVLAIPFVAGFIAGLSALIPVWWKKSKALRTQKKRLQELEAERQSMTAEEQEQKEEEKAEAPDIRENV